MEALWSSKRLEMCAIIDASVAGEVFGSDSCPASERFFDWISKGKGRVVAGGKLLKELEKVSGFREWSQNALLAGKMRIANETEVKSRTERLRMEGECRSNDLHIIALSQVSGARLLYSVDLDLHRDFTNKTLIAKPRGKVYSTHNDKNFTHEHANVLRMKNLCQAV